MSEQHWSKQAPTEPGWYWYWGPAHGDFPAVYFVHKDEINGKLMAEIYLDWHEVSEYGGWWIGPLERPALPQEYGEGELK